MRLSQGLGSVLLALILFPLSVVVAQQNRNMNEASAVGSVRVLLTAETTYTIHY
jgi:hypothetical protein